MRRYTICSALSLVLLTAAGCGGGLAAGMPTAAEMENAPMGPPSDAGAVPPKRAVVRNGIRPSPYASPRSTGRL